MNDLTTDQAAAYLTERGVTDRAGGPVQRGTVKKHCTNGAFPNARHAHGAPGRGYWLIPQADLDAWVARWMRMKHR